MTKFTIYIDMDLNDLKEAYRIHFFEKGRISKMAIATWIGNLAQADIEGLFPDELDEE